MPKQQLDGTILYEYPDEWADILLNGISVYDKYPVSATIWPDKPGTEADERYGWVLLAVNPETGLPHQWIDGQYQTYWEYGYLAIRDDLALKPSAVTTKAIATNPTIRS